MPAPQRKIAGDPVLPEGWRLVDPPALPEGWREVGADEPKTSVGDRLIGALKDPLGKRFGTGDDPNDEANMLDAKAAAKHDAEKVAIDEHATKLFKGAYDPSTQFETGAAGYLRFIDIARSDDLTNKQRKFRETFGESAELVQLSHPDGELRLYARRTSDEPYRIVPKSPVVVSSILSEPTIGSTVGSFIPGHTTTGTVAGTMLGVGVQKVVEDVRGYPEKSWGDTANRATQEGFLAGVTDLAFRGAGNVLFRKAFSTSGAAQAAMQEGFEPLAIGQVSESLLVQTGFRQVARLGVAGTPKLIDRQKRSLLESAQRQVAAGGDLTDTMIRDIVDAQKAELDAILTPSRVTRKETAQVLQNAIVTYEKGADAWVKELYDHAISLSRNVVFDASPAIAKAQEVSAGVQVAMKDGSFGNISPKLTGEMGDVIKSLQSMNPIMQPIKNEAGEWTAFEGIKQLRTRLWAIKTDPDAGLMQKYAGELYETLTGVMSSPVSGDPGFVKAWKIASGAHYLKEKNLEMAYVGKIISANHQNPEALQAIASRYFSPEHATELATFKHLMPAAQWGRIQEGFQADIMSMPNVSAAQNRLATFKHADPEGLNLLANPGAQRDIQQYLELRKRVEESPFTQALERNLKPRERVRHILTNGSEQDMDDLVRLSGGKNSDAALALKAGAYDLIIQEATETLVNKTQVINPKRLMQTVDELEKGRKLTSLFTDADWNRLRNHQVYARTVAEVSDAGTSMQRAELVAGAVQAPAKTLYGDAGKVVKQVVAPIVSMSMVGRLLSTPAAYDQLGQSGMTWARRGADALAVIEAEYVAKTQDNDQWRWYPTQRREP